MSEEDNKTNHYESNGLSSSTKEKEQNIEKHGNRKPGGWKAMPFILGQIFVFLFLSFYLFIYFKIFSTYT